MSAFILPTDYSALITDEQLAQITTNPIDITTSLAQSEEEIKEYLRHRFDVEFDMRPVTTAADPSSVSALLNARLYDATENKHYKCILEANDQPLNNQTYFQQIDDRNQKLIQIVIDVFLYHLHARLNPRNIPEHRRVRYDGDGDINNAMSAIKWLLMVQKGTITPSLTPLLNEDGEQMETGHSVIYGSSPNPNLPSARNNSYLTGG